jgi:hypothetical protein
VGHECWSADRIGVFLDFMTCWEPYFQSPKAHMFGSCQNPHFFSAHNNQARFPFREFCQNSHYFYHVKIRRLYEAPVVLFLLLVAFQSTIFIYSALTILWIYDAFVLKIKLPVNTKKTRKKIHCLHPGFWYSGILEEFIVFYHTNCYNKILLNKRKKLSNKIVDDKIVVDLQDLVFWKPTLLETQLIALILPKT